MSESRSRSFFPYMEIKVMIQSSPCMDIPFRYGDPGDDSLDLIMGHIWSVHGHGQYGLNIDEIRDLHMIARTAVVVIYGA